MPKRLAVVVDTFPRWSERFVARELGELRRRGIDFTVFCLRAGQLPPGGDPEWDGLLDRREVLPKWYAPSVALAALGGVFQLGDAARRRRFTTAASAGPLALARMSRAHLFERMLRDGNFAHVHAHFANLPSSIAWAAAAGANIPLSISVHARDLFIEPQLLEAKLASAARIFTCHARAQVHLELLCRRGNLANCPTLMHHGIPLERFPFRARAPQNPARLLAAGRFVVKKGFATLIAALRLPPLASANNWALTLLGDGPERPEIERAIRSGGLEQRVKIQAPLAGAELCALFDQTDLFVAPYEDAPDGDADGVPNVVLEAFVLGIPVIGTAAGGLGEALTPQTGVVVAQKDPAALAAAIRGFLDAPESFAAKTEATRFLIERAYDIRKNIAPLAELLE